MLLVGLVGEGRPECEGLPAEDGEGVDVGGFSVEFAEGYFGGHVAACAGAAGGSVGVGVEAVDRFEFFGESEVEYFYLVGYVEADVLGF